MDLFDIILSTMITILGILGILLFGYGVAHLFMYGYLPSSHSGIMIIN